MKKMKPIKRIPRIIAMLIAIVMLPFGFFLEGNNAFAEQKEYVYTLEPSTKSIEIYDLSGKYFFDTDRLESDAMKQIYSEFGDNAIIDIDYNNLSISNGIYSGTFIEEENCFIFPLDGSYEDWIDKNGNIHSSTIKS